MYSLIFIDYGKAYIYIVYAVKNFEDILMKR
jgi:hypothetical protein